MVKPIVLYTHSLGPNPWKSAIILEELELPYENRFMDPADVKKEPYEKLNPNGRVPCIEDPNTGMVLWESAAINEYLVDTYDKENRLTYRDAPNNYYVKQWLYFQMSGQGPYFGQAAWFTFRHAEHVPSAITRYRTEVQRVLGVLDAALRGRSYLVGDKCTLADLAFVTWDLMIPEICRGEEFLVTIEQRYPNWFAWHRRLLARPGVKRALDEQRRVVQADQSVIPVPPWEGEVSEV